MMHPGAGMAMGMGMAPNQGMMGMGMNMGMPSAMGMGMGMMNTAMVQQPKQDAFADFANFGKWRSWSAKIICRSGVGLSFSPSSGEGFSWAANKEYLNNVNYQKTNTPQLFKK